MMQTTFEECLRQLFTDEQLQSLRIPPNLDHRSSLGITTIEKIRQIVKAETSPAAFILYGTLEDPELVSTDFSWITRGENVLGILWTMRGPKIICPLFTPSTFTSLPWAIIVADSENSFRTTSFQPTNGLKIQITTPDTGNKSKSNDQKVAGIKIINDVTGRTISLTLTPTRSKELADFIRSTSW